MRGSYTGKISLAAAFAGAISPYPEAAAQRVGVALADLYSDEKERLKSLSIVQVLRQSQPQLHTHLPDGSRYADHVAPEGAHRLLHGLLIGFSHPEILDASGDLQKHLAVGRQNHAIAVGVEFRSAGTIAEALCFELTNPLFHAASAAVDLLVHVLGRGQRKFPGIAIVLRIHRVDDAGLNQTQIKLAGARVKALACDDASLLLPTFGIPTDPADDLDSSAGSGVALDLFALDVFEPLFINGSLSRFDRRKSHNEMSALSQAGLNDLVGIKAGVGPQNNNVVREKLPNALEQSRQIVLKHSSGIGRTGRTEYSDRIAVQVTKHRRQTTALIVPVVGLVFLVAVELDVG